MQIRCFIPNFLKICYQLWRSSKVLFKTTNFNSLPLDDLELTTDGHVFVMDSFKDDLDKLLSAISATMIRQSILVLQYPWTAEKFKRVAEEIKNSSAFFYVAAPADTSETEWMQGCLEGETLRNAWTT